MFVVPANAGTQCLYALKSLSPGLRRGDEQHDANQEDERNHRPFTHMTAALTRRSRTRYTPCRTLPSPR
jgi:hypothetical protein